VRPKVPAAESGFGDSQVPAPFPLVRRPFRLRIAAFEGETAIFLALVYDEARGPGDAGIALIVASKCAVRLIIFQSYS
jgi:hypothetical protein